MSAVAAAVGVAAVAGAAISSEASANAARSQSQAADRAMQQQTKQYSQQELNQRPYIDQGATALNQLSSQMPDLTRQFTSNDFKADPGYQFTLDQGMQAMQRSAAAKGFLDSTGTMQGLNNYAQGMASTQYGNAYNRFTDSQKQRYNMLSGIAGMGNTANGQMAQVGMNYSNNMNANMMAQGNAQSAGQMAQGNAINAGLGGAANGYMNMQMMNKMYPQQAGNYTPTNTYGSAGAMGGSSTLTMPEIGSSAAPSSSLYTGLAE